MPRPTRTLKIVPTVRLWPLFDAIASAATLAFSVEALSQLDRAFDLMQQMEDELLRTRDALWTAGVTLCHERNLLENERFFGWERRPWGL